MDRQHETPREFQQDLKRELNDRIFEVLTELGGGDEGEFLCECGDENCVETIPLPLREYAALHTRPDRPLLTLAEHRD